MDSLLSEMVPPSELPSIRLCPCLVEYVSVRMRFSNKWPELSHSISQGLPGLGTRSLMTWLAPLSGNLSNSCSGFIIKKIFSSRRPDLHKERMKWQGWWVKGWNLKEWSGQPGARVVKEGRRLNEKAIRNEIVRDLRANCPYIPFWNESPDLLKQLCPRLGCVWNAGHVMTTYSLPIIKASPSPCKKAHKRPKPI